MKRASQAPSKPRASARGEASIIDGMLAACSLQDAAPSPADVTPSSLGMGAPSGSFGAESHGCDAVPRMRRRPKSVIERREGVIRRLVPPLRRLHGDIGRVASPIRRLSCGTGRQHRRDGRRIRGAVTLSLGISASRMQNGASIMPLDRRAVGPIVTLPRKAIEMLATTASTESMGCSGPAPDRTPHRSCTSRWSQRIRRR
jgi:hypothetical protein